MMKSKWITGLFVLLASCAATVRCLAGEYENQRQAYVNGAIASVKYRIVDDIGVPVREAKVYLTFKSDGRPQDNASYEMSTDTNGLISTSHRVNDKLSVVIYKNGYYPSHDVQTFADSSKYTNVNGMWQPYGVLHTVILKRTRNPVIPGKRYLDQKIPAFDEWCGYDLEAADWIPPFGKGTIQDVLIKFSAREVNSVDFGYKMVLSFSHFPLAGACVRQKESFSELKCVYEAPTNMVYKQQIEFEVDRTGAARRVWNQLGDDSYLIFRTRTTVNDRGELVSAHYGRIDGGWKFYEQRSMQIQGVYFNPTPNDTNIEDAFSFEDAMLLNETRKQSSQTD